MIAPPSSSITCPADSIHFVTHYCFAGNKMKRTSRKSAALVLRTALYLIVFLMIAPLYSKEHTRCYLRVRDHAALPTWNTSPQSALPPPPQKGGTAKIDNFASAQPASMQSATFRGTEQGREDRLYRQISLAGH